jgi:hypothetical protein
MCREPLSVNVVVTDVWDDLELVAQKLAVRLACTVQEAQSRLWALPVTIDEDVTRATADRLVNEFEELGVNVDVTPCRVSSEPAPPEWLTAPDIPFVSERDYMIALAGGLARTKDDEIFLRVAAWHAGDDGFRDGAAAWIPYAQRDSWSVGNLERLLDILDPSKGPCRVMAGEICRQLCRFDDAKLWLAASALQSAEYEDEYQKAGVLEVAGFILDLANRGECALTKLPAAPE